jgi:hypothetical protein
MMAVSSKTTLRTIEAAAATPSGRGIFLNSAIATFSFNLEPNAGIKRRRSRPLE